MLKIFHVFAIIALLVIIGTQWLRVEQESPQIKPIDLASQLPLAAQGWQSEDLALGATEAVENAVEKTLNFDSYVHRRYQNGELDFTVYAAYWGPEKMPVNLVASHTPDRCWTESGWQCSEMRFQQTYTLEGRSLKPAEFRIFKSSNQTRYVLYWHLVGDNVYNYGKRFNESPHIGLWLAGAFQQITTGVPDQYFIRIGSTTPFEVLWEIPFFRQVMQHLTELTDLSVEEASHSSEQAQMAAR